MCAACALTCFATICRHSTTRVFYHVPSMPVILLHRGNVAPEALAADKDAVRIEFDAAAGPEALASVVERATGVAPSCFVSAAGVFVPPSVVVRFASRLEGAHFYVLPRADPLAPPPLGRRLSDEEKANRIPWDTRKKMKDTVLALLPNAVSAEALAVNLERKAYEEAGDDVEYAARWEQTIERVAAPLRVGRARSMPLPHSHSSALPPPLSADGISFPITSDGRVAVTVLRSDLERLEALRNATGLRSMRVAEVLAHFDRFVGVGRRKTRVDRAAFVFAMSQLPAVRRLAASQRGWLLRQLTAVFALLDLDGNGTLDRKELGSGLSILCGGPRLERLQYAFVLFDDDGDGTLDMSEMSDYVRALFRGLLALAVYGAGDEFKVSRARLASMEEQVVSETVTACFRDVDVNRDSRLDFAEFANWHLRSPQFLKWLAVFDAAPLPNEPPPPSEPPSGRRAASTAPLDSAAGRPGRPGLDGQEASGRGDSDDDSTVAPLPSAHTRLGPSPSLPRVAARPPQAAVSPLSGTAVAKAAAAAAADEQLVFEIAVDGGRRVRVANPDLERIRELQRSTGLGTITTDELNALYERYTSGAGMDQLAFTACLQGVATHRKLTLPRQAQLRTQADALFRWLDRDSDGELSRQEFVAGLAVLCAGSKDAKLFTLFRLADADADGYVTPAELATLLRTLYRGIVAGVDADTESVEALEQVVVEDAVRECFADLDSDRDGRISLQEWSAWRARPMALSWLNMLEIVRVATPRAPEGASLSPVAAAAAAAASSSPVAPHSDAAVLRVRFRDGSPMLSFSERDLEERQARPRHGGLGHVHLVKLWLLVADRTRNSNISRDDFVRSVLEHVAGRGRPELRSLAEQAFDNFARRNAPGGSSVDCSEVIASLAAFSEAPRATKLGHVRTIFAQMDVPVADLFRMLRSVFRGVASVSRAANELPLAEYQALEERATLEALLQCVGYDAPPRQPAASAMSNLAATFENMKREGLKVPSTRFVAWGASRDAPAWLDLLGPAAS